MNKKILLPFLLAFSGAGYASGLANGYEVDYVRVDHTGLAYVNFMSALINSPASCTETPGFTKALAFDTNTAGGKSILSVVLMAKASGKTIYAVGTGSCESYGIIENWSYGWIQ